LADGVTFEAKAAGGISFGSYLYQPNNLAMVALA
jgi:hypothetical protein